MARGSITPRATKDGKVRYRVKWESRGPDGKRVHHSATTTKKAARSCSLRSSMRSTTAPSSWPRKKPSPVPASLVGCFGAGMVRSDRA